MTDICQFINSRDVADHLRGIGYEFSMPEAAFIVHWSHDATLDERIAAWREIAETMPDCKMDGRRNMKPIPSFKRFLHDYIDFQERELERFFNPSSCIYSHSIRASGYEDDDNLFSNAESCLEYAKQCWNGDNIEGYRLNKRPVDKPDSCRNSWLYLNDDFEVVSVDAISDNEADVELSLQFDGMWFAFPTPFKRGDIVVERNRFESAPFVLNYLSSWRREDFLANGFSQHDWIVGRCDRTFERLERDGDSTDMGAYGYGVGEGHYSRGSQVWGEVIYRDHMASSHLDLECFKGELEDTQRWAAVLSAHLKGEIQFDEAANLLHFLLADSESRQLRSIYDGWYPEKYYPDNVWKKIRRDRKWGR